MGCIIKAEEDKTKDAKAFSSNPAVVGICKLLRCCFVVSLFCCFVVLFRLEQTVPLLLYIVIICLLPRVNCVMILLHGG
jgi:hypothetical protein